MLIAAIAAVFGFSGIFHATAGLFQFACYLATGFAILSCLFCLFEDCEDSMPREYLPENSTLQPVAVGVK